MAKRTPEERRAYYKGLIEKDFWTNNFYKRAYPSLEGKSKMPIVVLSYNRYGQDESHRGIFIESLREDEHYNKDKTWPIYIVVRKEQYEDYKKYCGDLVTVVCPLSGEVIDNAGKVRNFICETFSGHNPDYPELNFDSIIILDDDIKEIDYSIQSTYKSDDTMKKSEYLEIADICGVAAMWQIAHQKVSALSDKILFSNIADRGFCFNDIFTDKNRSAMMLRGYPALGCHAINIKRLYDLSRRENLHSPCVEEKIYGSTSVVGHEDYDLYFECLERGYLNCQFAWLNCWNQPMKASENFEGSDINKRFSLQSEKMKKMYEGQPKMSFLDFRVVKGKDNVKISRPALYKYMDINGYMPIPDEFDFETQETLEFSYEQESLF